MKKILTTLSLLFILTGSAFAAGLTKTPIPVLITNEGFAINKITGQNLGKLNNQQIQKLLNSKKFEAESTRKLRLDNNEVIVEGTYTPNISLKRTDGRDPILCWINHPISGLPPCYG